MLIPTLVAAALLTPVSGHATPAPSPRESVTAVEVPAASALKLDGDLNDAVWQRAVPITDFRQRDPHEGAPPTFPTEVRVAYDDTSIYVAVEAFDPDPDKLVGRLTRRDSESPSETGFRFTSTLYDDHRTAYEFAVNPAGVKVDGLGQ